MAGILESTDDKIGRLIDETSGNTLDLGGKSLQRRVFESAAVIVIGIALVFAVWYLVGSVYNIFFSHAFKMPLPPEVLGRLGEYLSGRLMFGQSIWDHIAASLRRWIAGFLVAAGIGLVLGFLMSLNDSLRRVLMVPVGILQMIPGLAWLPVVMILFGFGDLSAMFMVGVVVIAPVAVNVSNGLRNVPKVNVRVAQMSELTGWSSFLEVYLPFSVLDILNGLRVGLGNSWRMIIAAEMVVGVMTGIGFFIKGASDNLDYVGSFAGIIVICIIGLLFEKVFFETIEDRVRKRTGIGVVQ